MQLNKHVKYTKHVKRHNEIYIAGEIVRKRIKYMLMIMK